MIYIAVYNKIHSINRNADAAKNALIILDSYAQIMPLSIEDSLEDIKWLFK